MSHYTKTCTALALRVVRDRTTRSLEDALREAYRAGYARCRSEAAQAVGTLIADWELEIYEEIGK